jgi:MEMO1 family protein
MSSHRKVQGVTVFSASFFLALLILVGACSPAAPQAAPPPAPSVPAAATPAVATTTPVAADVASAPAAPVAEAAPTAPASPKTEAAAPAATGAVQACRGAGQWFPARAEPLASVVDIYLSASTVELAQPPAALIVPHAGYEFSGITAGKAFATLKGRAYKHVIVMGLSHRTLLKGASVLRVDAYETPLGRIPADVEARDALLKCAVVSEQPAAHAKEHSAENQFPFLQRVLGNFKMIELLVGEMTPAQRSTLADALRPLLDKDTLLVVSSDFTHYGPNYQYVPFSDRIPENLAALNGAALQQIFAVDVPGWDGYLARTHDTICGQAGIGLLLKIMEPMDDIRGTLVATDYSGRLTGDWTNVVTYSSVAFWHAGDGLTAAEQKTLLALARDTAAAFTKTGQVPEFNPDKYPLTPALKGPGAAFVTLKNAGELRGCIGHIVAVEPLYQSVMENACQACRDPRFTARPIKEAEVPALSVEISVLSPMRRLMDAQKVQVGRDGLLMSRGRQHGLLLPQVPGEQGWNRDQFLEGLCQKAGLPRDAWKDPQTEIFRFSAQVFGEEKPEK